LGVLVGGAAAMFWRVCIRSRPTAVKDTIEAQVQGGTFFGLTAALYGAITLKNGRVEQGNFDTYRPLRIDEAPVVETHLVKSSEAPGGFGEAPTAVVAPAVANAIFAATAKRIRTLPIDTNLLKFPSWRRRKAPMMEMLKWEWRQCHGDPHRMESERSS
jgi:hypothetical protein